MKAVFELCAVAATLCMIFAAQSSHARPTITQSPQSVALYAGRTASFSVQATSSLTMTYQWMTGHVGSGIYTDLSNVDNISGAASSNLVITNIGTVNALDYVLAVSDSSGSVTSAVATLTVQADPTDAYGAAVLADNPAAYWRMNEASGSVLHDYAGGHNGSYSGGFTLGQTGISSNGLSVLFDGKTAGAVVPYAAALNTTKFSVECWSLATAAMSSSGGYGTVVENRNGGTSGWTVYGVSGTTDNWHLFLGGASGWDDVSAGAMASGQWNHVVGTYDGTNWVNYVNGAKTVSSAWTYVPNSSYALYIGNLFGAYYWPGYITEVAVYNTPLTAAQVLNHYTLAGSGSSPVVSTNTGVLPYAVASSPWAIDQRGDQRAVVSVTQSVSAIRVDLPWRRRDSNPQNKNIVVVDATTGAVVANRTVISSTRETGTIVFQPQTVPGDYYIYYLPFAGDVNAGFYAGGFVAYQSTASSAWLSANGLPGNAGSLTAATPLRIESRLPIDNFWPMEVPMTAAEKAAFLATNSDGYLVFPEDRLHPIKMKDEMPYRWLTAQPTNLFTATALRDEYYAFQLGLYAVTQSLQNVHVTFSDLAPAAGGSAIPASAFNCLNLAGTNWDGSALTKTLTVATGAIQPLWMGVLIPAMATPGLYTGTVTVSADNAPSKVVNLAITVSSATAVDHGDDTPVNQSRLRWMDSQLGVSDEPIPPYTPMSYSNQTVGVLGRTLAFNSLGLPSSIQAGANQILQSPVQFNVLVGGNPVVFSGGAPVVTVTNRGRVNWQSTATGGAFTMQTSAQMEFDGYVKYQITLTAASVTAFKGVLQIPLTAAASTFMTGIGYDGGVRPSSYSWSWSSYYNSVWLGGVHAGLQAKFLGSTYTGPLLNLYAPSAPATWGGGSVLVTNFGSGALIQADGGIRTLAAGGQVQYEFALLITPVKPIDPVLQFGDRYYHNSGDPTPPANWKKWNVNVINVHQGCSVNPYINWPFADPATTTRFITNCQTQYGDKVKLYYTLRELTQYAAEIWAMRSLGNEMLAGGTGGGFPWLQEHYISNYNPNMYTPLANGLYDAAVITSPNSRYDNYYVEGVNWLAQHDHMDGLYLDDASLDRVTLRRARRVLKQANPGARIDLHSCTCLAREPINQYVDCLPYLDRLWFGENFYYNTLTPEQWLVQVSGIPFGPMGEMLQDNGNPWLGAVFGLTSRYGHSDPLPVWKIWDQFGGLTNAAMLGWWEASPAVTASDSNVKVTAFVKQGKTLLAVGNFSSSQTAVTLDVNWAALGLDSNTCSFYAPGAIGFQAQALYQPGDSITIPAKQGWMFIVQSGNSNLVSAPQLVARYRMSESSGTTAIDDTGHYNGQYVGGPVLGGTAVPSSAEASLRSVTFSGSQWLKLPSALADTVFRSGGPWTISFWVRPTLPSASYNATFVWSDASGAVQGILFYLEANGSLDFWIGDGSTWNNAPNFNPGTGIQNSWYHIAASYDGDTILCYLNGQPFETRPITSFLYPAAGQPITVGSRPGNSPTYDLRGKLTDLRIYNGVLSGQDVKLLYTYPGRRVPADVASTSASVSYSTLGFGRQGAGNLVLSIPTVASWQYQLQASTNLASGNWVPVGSVLTPAGNQLLLTNDLSTSESRFFRLRITP
jgi:hypothetical protein